MNPLARRRGSADRPGPTGLAGRSGRSGSPGSVLVRQRYACAYEEGPRAVPPTPPALRLARPVLAPATVRACAITPEPVLALTYDDGPDPATTNPVLDALAQRRVRATFFVLAEQVLAHPGVLRRIVADGHEVALHGFDHTRLTTLPFAQAIGSIRRSRDIVEEVAQRRVRLFRPAYGAQTPQLAVATRALGLDVVLWSAWARDWTDEPTQVLLHRAIGAAHPGGIVLLHDASVGVSGFRGRGAVGEPGGAPGAGAEPGASRVLPTFDRGALTGGLIDELRSRGYRFPTVSGLAQLAPVGRMVWFERASA